MKKVIKIIYLLLFLVILIPSLYLALRYQKNPEQIYPYPYKMETIDSAEIKEAEQADIIVMGDSSAQLLANSLSDFPSEVAPFLKTPPKIYHWGRPAETPAQTLAKLKSLSKLPALIIYHGGRDALQYQKFNLKAFPLLKKNIKLTQNDMLMTLIMAYPQLSRFIYHPLAQIELSATRPYSKSLPAVAVLEIIEVLYQLYKMEAGHLFQYIKEKDGHIWVIPQALNLELPPFRVCENSTDLTQESVLNDVAKLNQEGRIKEAFNKANQLIKTSPGNSKAYYQIGKLLVAMGNYQEAKKAYYKAMIYDCGLMRSNPIILKILMEEAERRQFKVIDFNRLVTNQLGRNILFLNDKDPQPLYYQQLNAIIKKEFIKFIK
jgi:tetratricopeptide (TPR) repeat protein